MAQVMERLDESNSRAPTTYSDSCLKEREHCCRPPFWAVIACCTVVLFGLAYGFRAVAGVLEDEGASKEILGSLRTSVEAQRRQIQQRLQDQTKLEHASVLDNITKQISAFFIELPDRAVDGLWSAMMSFHKFGPHINGSTRKGRWQLAYRMWTELSGEEAASEHELLRADSLFVAFDTGALTGVMRSFDLGPRRHFFYEAEPFPGGSNTTPLRRQDVDGSGSEPRGSARAVQNLTRPPFYDTQLKLALEEPTAAQAWSRVDGFGDSPPQLFWTSPVAYCGNYSCLSGVVAAGISLATVGGWCTLAWNDLRSRLRQLPYGFAITPNNSAVFVVNQASRSDPFQVGRLVSWSGSWYSDQQDGGLYSPTAVNSTSPIVRNTTAAIFARFGSFNSTELRQEETHHLTFRAHTAELVSAEECYGQDGQQSDCMHVAARSVELDFQTRWLVVMVLPARAFSGPARRTWREVDEMFDDTESVIDSAFSNQRLHELFTLLGTGIAVVVVSMRLGTFASRDIKRLRDVAVQLTTLDFSKTSPELERLRAGGRSCIGDVCELQQAALRLEGSVKMFSRFVPQPVVRNIVLGDANALRLHVKPREVTVMFTDIQDFTSLSEKLNQTDLLTVLCIFFLATTRVIEEHGGVVTEILGDALLAYWNTPDDVEGHPTKACAAALRQQEAIREVNRELARARWPGCASPPQIAARTGLHVGQVLSGNLGSETKMKFGCLGDTVNLASRLEDLCKHFGVSVLCSRALYEALDPDAGILCRRLCRAQVKGKLEPTDVYEVVSCPSPSEASGPSANASGSQHEQMQLYEQALSAYEAGDLASAERLAGMVVERWTEDTAAARLLSLATEQRAQQAAGTASSHWSGTVVIEK